jgi:membrane protein DedA with SNARE-associated domain
MTELEIFLREHGLWAVLVAAAIEGDLTLVLTGMMVHHGIWPAYEALAAGASGAVLGDCLYFWLGHSAASRWFRTLHARKVIHLEQEYSRHHGWKSIFISRYIYGARIATMVYWGSRKLPWSRFVPLDILSCLLWAMTFGGVGYAFSSSIEAAIVELRRLEWRLLSGAVVFAALLVIRYLWVNRADDGKQEQAG